MIIKPSPPMEQEEYTIGNNTVYPIVVVVQVTLVALYNRNSLGLMIIQVKKLVLQFVRLSTGRHNI